MNMIHAEKLVYEYDKRDEEGTAPLTGLILMCRKVLLWRFSVITVRESLLLQSI